MSSPHLYPMLRAAEGAAWGGKAQVRARILFEVSDTDILFLVTTISSGTQRAIGVRADREGKLTARNYGHCYPQQENGGYWTRSIPKRYLPVKAKIAAHWCHRCQGLQGLAPEVEAKLRHTCAKGKPCARCANNKRILIGHTCGKPDDGAPLPGWLMDRFK